MKNDSEVKYRRQCGDKHSTAAILNPTSVNESKLKTPAIVRLIAELLSERKEDREYDFDIRRTARSC